MVNDLNNINQLLLINLRMCLFQMYRNLKAITFVTYIQVALLGYRKLLFDHIEVCIWWDCCLVLNFRYLEMGKDLPRGHYMGLLLYRFRCRTFLSEIPCILLKSFILLKF